MVDKVPNQENVETYEFKDDQAAAGYQYSEQAGSGATATKFKRRPMVTILVFIVAAAILWEIFHILFSTPSQLNEAQPNISPVAAPATTPTTFSDLKKDMSAAPQVTPVNSSAQPSAPPKPAPDFHALKTQMDTVHSENQALATQLAQEQTDNQAQMGEIQTELGKLSDTVAELNQSVTALNDRQLEADNAKQQAYLQAQMKKQQALAQLRTQKNYFVVAVVPGRAWLKATDGSSVTVQRGQSLRGYGKVLSIDPYSGIVKTSYATLQYAMGSS